MDKGSNRQPRPRRRAGSTCRRACSGGQETFRDQTAATAAVEIKVTITAEQEMKAVRLFGLDRSNAESREIYFFDTPWLDCFRRTRGAPCAHDQERPGRFDREDPPRRSRPDRAAMEEAEGLQARGRRRGREGRALGLVDRSRSTAGRSKRRLRANERSETVLCRPGALPRSQRAVPRAVRLAAGAGTRRGPAVEVRASGAARAS